MSAKEPVILASIARVVGAAAVGLAAKYGLSLDPVEVVGLVLAVEMAAATWVRSKVWSQASVSKLTAPGAQAS